ncbi:MAG TPA: DUF5681 domain-containing protein [Steroidobacteraceae bacterium]|nr:DUF5681 domain-containing protein [Steroidobacteraceae bacterium]
MAFVKGQSGNPSGRPKGARNRKTIIMEELSRDGSALAAAIKAHALQGDAQLLALWLSRLEPPARKRVEHVQFEFDPKATPAENIEKVLASIAAGDLSLEDGSMIINGIEKLAAARAATEVTDKDAQLIAAFKDMAGKVPV